MSTGPDFRSGEATNRWAFFSQIKSLLLVFPQATTGQKAAILAMSIAAVTFIGLGLVGSVVLPAWSIVVMFLVANILIFMTAATLLFVERKVAVPFRCRQIPVYPPDDAARKAVPKGLEEIRRDTVDQLQAKYPDIIDQDIRANIFLLARIVGGAADGEWRLVIHPDFAINMNHPPELQLQFSVGQGATGVAFRDGTYQLSRRLANPQMGNWDRKFQMTPELNAQAHSRLKWIITFPLLKPNTNEAVGVLNIDGLVDVPDDDILNAIASSVRQKIEVIANRLALQRSICVGIDELGVMEHV